MTTPLADTMRIVGRSIDDIIQKAAGEGRKMFWLTLIKNDPDDGQLFYVGNISADSLTPLLTQALLSQTNATKPN